MATGREILRTTCPRDCYDSCGIAVVKRNGAITKVLGDPEHPISRGALCGKCAIAYNGVWRDPESRVTQPLKRVGPKGKGEFVAVDWSVALGDIARSLNALRVADRAAAILHTHYTGTVGLIAGFFPLRFFNAIGATEVDPDTVCNKAGHMALAYTLGASLTGFDPRSAADAAAILVWGANPSASAPHMHRHWLPEAPGKVIVIDPVRHATASAADLHLQLRPGSDAALAFAMMHVAERRGLIDRAFVDRSVLGWDELRPAVEQATPDWAETVTGVPATLIEEAAILYATGPSLLWLGQGMQRQPKGGNAFRAVASLCAVTGNLGKPGTGLTYMSGPATRGIDLDYVTAPHLAKAPASISHMDLAEVLADPGRSAALICWNNNIAASSPRQKFLRAALQREDLLHVCLEVFRTDTTDYADYILPAASFLEFDDLVVPYFHHTISAQTAVQAPLGESLPNQEVFRRLALEMGLNTAELYETDPAILASLLAQTGSGLSFAELATTGTIEMFREPFQPFADGRFPTPSGKVEIASASAARDGHPRLPHPHADAPSRAGALRVLSPASEFAMNTSHANDPKIRRRLGSATVTLSPAEAHRRGLITGESVELTNETGSLPLVVKISDTVLDGTALVHKGRWPKYEESSANVNVLNPGHKTDIGESSCVHAVEAELRRPGRPEGDARRVASTSPTERMVAEA